MATRFERFNGTGDAGKAEVDRMESVRVSQASRQDAKPVEVNGRLETFSDEQQRLKQEKTRLQAEVTRMNMGIEKACAKFNRQNPKAHKGHWLTYRADLPEFIARTKHIERIREIELRLAVIKGAARAENINLAKQQNTWESEERPLHRLVKQLLDEQKLTNQLLQQIAISLAAPPEPAQ